MPQCATLFHFFMLFRPDDCLLDLCERCIYVFDRGNAVTTPIRTSVCEFTFGSLKSLLCARHLGRHVCLAILLRHGEATQCEQQENGAE